jgi:hypothetical protein
MPPQQKRMEHIQMLHKAKIESLNLKKIKRDTFSIYAQPFAFMFQCKTLWEVCDFLRLEHGLLNKPFVQYKAIRELTNTMLLTALNIT